MHRYTVELRILGKELDTAAVTNKLALQPSSTRQVGERRGKSAFWEEAMWGYDGFSEEATDRDWESLEDGLNFLLDRIATVNNAIREYKRGNTVILWCGHFQSSFDGGPVFSATLLKRLGDLGVEMFIDNYFSDEENNAAPNRTGTKQWSTS